MKLVGVDIGGTFTDIVLLEETNHTMQVHKVPTTPQDPSLGLLRGLQEIAQTDSAQSDGIAHIIHGTTVATNAVLERSGAMCGLIATSGFRDILELRRRDRPHLYGLTGSYEPLVPRERRLEVSERISAEGDVLQPLDELALLDAAEQLVQIGVEAIVISFLNSYINASHERRAKTLLEERWPQLYVVASADILPLYREFERTSTAVVNAYVQPIVDRYLANLEQQLIGNRNPETINTNGTDSPHIDPQKSFVPRPSEQRQDKAFLSKHSDLLIMQSNGGMMSVDRARHLAINTVLSGPVAGAIAATRIAAESGFENIIAYDMGGTSLDVSLIIGGYPSVANGMELEFGIPIMVSMLDIQTVGAGGGSIARVDAGGILEVGPESAGADPGPVCYGQGGTAPTVTDAHVVLGRINPQHSITGQTLAVDQARTAIAEQIGQPLELGLEEAAQAILTVTNNRIAGRIRRISIDRGYDPRDFVLFPFGGAGPLLVSFLLRELGIEQALVPYHPGIASAWGCVVADLQYDFVTMVNQRLTDVEPASITQIFAEHQTEGEASIKQVRVVREAEVGYEGQTHIIRVPLPDGPLSADQIALHFRRAYMERYGQVEDAFGGLIDLLDQLPIRLLNLRTAVIGERHSLALRDFVLQPQTSLRDAQKGKRSIYVDGELIDCPVYERTLLPWGSQFAGPAVIEQTDTTVWLEPWVKAEVAEGGSLLVFAD